MEALFLKESNSNGLPKSSEAKRARSPASSLFSARSLSASPLLLRAPSRIEIALAHLPPPLARFATARTSEISSRRGRQVFPMGSPMGSFLDLVSEHSVESQERYSSSEESESESTQIEEDLTLVGAMTVVPKSRTNNFNHKRQKTSAAGSPGSSTPGSDESHADDEGEGLTAKPAFIETLENMWVKKKEFETFKENRKQERHDQIIALEKEKLELQKKELELKQWIQDNKVMSMNIGGMSERQQKYFLSLQDEIFARRFGDGSG